MNKLPPPQEIIRISLADEIPAIPGIYILAYLSKVVYVGKAETSVMHRIQSHKNNALSERLGAWMIRVSDWENVRLDILIPPVNVDDRVWLRNAERKCINSLNPLLNIQIPPEES